MRSESKLLLADCRARLAILGEEIARALREVDHALAVSSGCVQPAPKVTELRLPGGGEVKVKRRISSACAGRKHH